MTEYLVDTLENLELKKRSDIHWERKIWHMTSVFGMFLAYVFLPPMVSSLILVFAIATFLPVDFLRLRYPAFNDWVVHALKPIMRTNEIHKIAGTTYLLTGVGIIVAVFPRPIVALTLLFLAFADPMASFIGIKYGKDKIFGHKSIQGFIAAFVVCTFCTMMFLSFYNVMLDRVIVVSLLAGLIGGLAELVPIGKLDDNFTLPLISSLGLYILFSLFGLFAT
jgi:diacylglycerol kinase (CTP)